MTSYYIAVTYDICEHNNLYEVMNHYKVDLAVDLHKQLSEWAKQNVAPLVKVFESETSDFNKSRLYKEYRFQQYDCHCEE